MLSPEPRRIPDSQNPPVRDSREDIPGEDTGRDGSATVLRSSSSSAQRLKGTPPPSSPIPLPAPGAMIDTFRLEEAIGVGGMGAVFRALDTRLDRMVASANASSLPGR
jgi:hypothetical protein